MSSKAAREQYEAHVGGVLTHVWKREGQFIVVDPAELNTPLTEAMGREAGSTRVDPDWLPSDQQALRELDREQLLGLVLELIDERDETRGHAVKTMLDFLFAKGPDPLAALERLFMLARATHEGHDWNMRQGEMAALFGHSKQNWQHLEERVIHDLVQRFSRPEFVMSGGKSATAKQKYQEIQKGNKHRAHGKKAGDEGPRMPAAAHGELTLSTRAKQRARELRDAAERRRLAEMCGCSPEEIDLGRISPAED